MRWSATAATASGELPATNFRYRRSSSVIRTCLPRTGLYTAGVPVACCIARVVPGTTVLFTTTTSGS